MRKFPAYNFQNSVRSEHCSWSYFDGSGTQFREYTDIYFNNDKVQLCRSDEPDMMKIEGLASGALYVPFDGEGHLFRKLVRSQNDIKLARCVYCCRSREPVASLEYNQSIPGSEYLNPAIRRTFKCSECGWWLTLSHSTVRDSGYDNWETRIRQEICYAKLEEYDLAAREAPILELQRWLVRHPTDLAFINPTSFELVIADCFKNFYPGAEVIHVGQVGDRGIDIKLIRADDHVTLVQIKRRTNIDAAEGVAVVRELNGVLLQEGVPCGMVVTTARRFSRAAIEAAGSNDHSLARYKVDLLKFDDVVDLLRIGEQRRISSSRNGHVVRYSSSPSGSMPKSR